MQADSPILFASHGLSNKPNKQNSAESPRLPGIHLIRFGTYLQHNTYWLTGLLHQQSKEPIEIKFLLFAYVTDGSMIEMMKSEESQKETIIGWIFSVTYYFKKFYYQRMQQKPTKSNSWVFITWICLDMHHVHDKSPWWNAL